MATFESAKNQDPTLFCAYYGGPRDGLKTGDLPAGLSGKKLTGMVSRTPLGQPHQFSLYAVYECTSDAQIDGFWQFHFRRMEGPNGETLVATPTEKEVAGEAVASHRTGAPSNIERGPESSIIKPGSVCPDIGTFNSMLLAWLTHTSEPTVGMGIEKAHVTVQVGNTLCGLSANTTRVGVQTYLSRALAGDTSYWVVPSSKGVIHRVSLGLPQRIPGFYLYTRAPYDSTQLISPAEGPTFDAVSVAMLILDAVAVLHRRGHQRLRVFPDISGSGMHWRIAVTSTDNLRRGQWPSVIDPRKEFRYTTGSAFEVGGARVTPATTAEQIADEILGQVSDSGLGQDWAYAGWYIEVLGLVLRHNKLPVNEVVERDDGRYWKIGFDGVLVSEPPTVRGLS